MTGPQWALVYVPRLHPGDVGRIKEIPADCIDTARRNGFRVLADDRDVEDPKAVRRRMDDEDAA